VAVVSIEQKAARFVPTGTGRSGRYITKFSLETIAFAAVAREVRGSGGTLQRVMTDTIQCREVQPFVLLLS
jgi:hypothetical protein